MQWHPIATTYPDNRFVIGLLESEGKNDIMMVANRLSKMRHLMVVGLRNQGVNL